MKNIEFYEPKKYEDSSKYEKVAEHIYRTEDTFLGGDMYVTSLKFEQEPEFHEGDSPSNISQYPLEDILDKYLVAISDFYDEENRNSVAECYQEFSGSDLENVKQLTEIVGTHVYEKEYLDEEDGETYLMMVIE